MIGVIESQTDREKWQEIPKNKFLSFLNSCLKRSHTNFELE